MAVEHPKFQALQHFYPLSDPLEKPQKSVLTISLTAAVTDLQKGSNNVLTDTKTLDNYGSYF